MGSPSMKSASTDVVGWRRWPAVMTRLAPCRPRSNRPGRRHPGTAPGDRDRLDGRVFRQAERGPRRPPRRGDCHGPWPRSGRRPGNGWRTTRPRHGASRPWHTRSHKGRTLSSAGAANRRAEPGQQMVVPCCIFSFQLRLVWCRVRHSSPASAGRRSIQTHARRVTLTPRAKAYASKCPFDCDALACRSRMNSERCSEVSMPRR